MTACLRVVLGFVLLLAGLLCQPTGAYAAEYPAYSDLYVNDVAKVLSDQEVATLRSELEVLKDDTGVEMTILTIPTRSAYEAGGTLEEFATAIFNDWGVGRADRNDGILVYVATEDREMRVVLGQAYTQGYDVIAQDIVRRTILPAFRDGKYGAGLVAGSREVMERVARRHADGQAPEAVPDAKGGIERLIPWGFGVLIAGLIGKSLFGRQIGDWSFRFRRCPTCGQRGLHREHILGVDDPVPPSGRVPPVGGQVGRIVTRCRSCNWRDERPWNRAASSFRSSSGRGGSFGGGRSSGGGASGRW